MHLHQRQVGPTRVKLRGKNQQTNKQKVPRKGLLAMYKNSNDSAGE